jgi:hypothetical protein
MLFLFDKGRIFLHWSVDSMQLRVSPVHSLGEHLQSTCLGVGVSTSIFPSEQLLFLLFPPYFVYLVNLSPPGPYLRKLVRLIILECSSLHRMSRKKRDVIVEH